MARRAAFALGLAVAVCLAPAASGCSTSSNLAGNSDAGENDGACAAAGGSCITGGALRCPVVGPQGCGARGVCCLVNANMGDAGAGDAGACPSILAVSYSQACTIGSDCVAVGLGNACFVCEIGCANSAISKSAEGQYRSHVAKSPANGADCGCPVSPPGPCCVGGLCEMGSECENVSSAGDAAGDTGADSATDGGGADAANDSGPLDGGGG